MKAIVKTPFTGAPDGKRHPVRFQIGDTVEGDLAAVAVEQGWAEGPKAEPKRKAKAAAKGAAEPTEPPAADGDLLG